MDADSLLAEKFIAFSEPLLERLNSSVTIIEECLNNEETVCENPEFHGVNMSTINVNNTIDELKLMLYAERRRRDYAQNMLDYWTMKNETYHKNIIEDTALIHVYFKQLGIVNYTRDELYSAIDFIGKQ